MSRIEKALEKAAELRNEKERKPVAENPVPYPAAAAGEQVAGEAPEIRIDHPLVVTFRDPRSPVAEEFRKLKSSLVTLARDGGHKVLMVTSSLAGEGKSITAINLAISLAQEYDHTVLLIDADLRRPAVHKYFNLQPQPGLADCLTERVDPSSVVVRTGIGHLSLIPAGKEVENPAELLGSRRMAGLIQEMKSRYPERFIILDAPPVLPVAETRSLGNFVDGVLFVIREGLVSLTNIREALATLPPDKTLGLVYNDIRNESLGGRYHYYYHGY